MTFYVKRKCGCTERVDFRGSDAAWKERKVLMERLPCTKCHTQRLKERVKDGVPTLTELCKEKP